MASRNVNCVPAKSLGLALAAMLLIFFAWSQPTSAAPSNPNASAKAIQVLDYLQGLPKRADRRVLSGQNVGHGANTTAGYSQYVTKLQSQTQKWVALVGVDYGFTADPAGIAAANQVVKNHWNAGGLATVSIHFANPFTGGDSWDRSGVKLTELLTPGTAVNTKWMGQLDKVATGLAELRDAGVVVLWRPLHEMNGDWFWWSSNVGAWVSPQDFVKLWTQIFDYFTKTKGLNNLLWVYGPNVRTNTTAVKPTTYYYPGSGMVDIVGLDAYLDSLDAIDSNQSYSSLIALGKPFGLTEFGPKTVLDGSFDDTTVIQGIKSRAPLATFWLQWHSWPSNAVAMVDNRNAAALLGDPWGVTRDQVNLGSNPTITDASPTVKDAAPAPKDAGPAAKEASAAKKDLGTPTKEASPAAKDVALAKPEAAVMAKDAAAPRKDVAATAKDAIAVAKDAVATGLHDTSSGALIAHEGGAASEAIPRLVSDQGPLAAKGDARSAPPAGDTLSLGCDSNLQEESGCSLGEAHVFPPRSLDVVALGVILALVRRVRRRKLR